MLSHRSSTGIGSRPGNDEAHSGKLDPIRWRRPGRETLIRFAVVAALLGAAAAVIWLRPVGCTPADRAGPTSQIVASSSGPGAEPRPADASGSAGGPGHRASSEPDRGAWAGSASGARPPVPPGTVGVPVRLAEPSTLSLVHVGDRVDLVGVGPTGGRISRIADRALVLGVAGVDDPSAGGLLLALGPAQARRAVSADEQTRFAVLLRHADPGQPT